MEATISSATRLIVNGDDFGASNEVNEAIIQAFKGGVLTSCSLLAAGEAFDHAVQLAAENNGLAVGLHLVTVMGRSVLPPSEIPDLVDGLGSFPSDPTFAGLKYHFSSSARKQLRRELDAQFRRFLSTGLPMAHVDSHLHMHVHPVIFNIAVELAEHYNVRRMRIPADDIGMALRFDRSGLAGKAAQSLIFRLLTRRMRKRLCERCFVFPDRVYGHFQSGHMTEAYVLHVLERLGPGAFEIYFHPGFCGEAACDVPLVESGHRREFEILTSPRVTEAIERFGIERINYFHLEATR